MKEQAGQLKGGKAKHRGDEWRRRRDDTKEGGIQFGEPVRRETAAGRQSLEEVGCTWFTSHQINSNCRDLRQ